MSMFFDKKYKNYNKIDLNVFQKEHEENVLNKLKILKAGDSILVFLWLLSSTTLYRRVSKKDLVYYGRVVGSTRSRYLSIFSGRCVRVVKKTRAVQVRSYCKNDGINLIFFANSPNFINLEILNLHKRFRRRNKNKRSRLYHYINNHVSKLKRLREY